MSDEVQRQRQYYAHTASQYDSMHVWQTDEHQLALSVMASLIRFYRCESVLDVGAGTGRTLTWLKTSGLAVKAMGVEPVAELRACGYEKGIGTDELIDGDATNLSFREGEFDVVCCFGVLHHIPKPELAIRELLRVARRMVFISDSNNFGQGRTLARIAKQVLNAFGLWPLLNFIKTRGQGFTISDEDGLAYSYSLFNNYRQIRSECAIVHVFNTQDSASINPYRGAPHVALAGIKRSV